MKYLRHFLHIAGWFLVSASVLSAQNADAIKAQIRDRLPEVDALKMQGAVGENNKGYLEERTALRPSQKKVVAEENADRRQLYQIVARNTGVSVDEVGVQRALQIRENSAKGIWLQKPDGEWYRK